MTRIQVSMLNIARYFSFWSEENSNKFQRDLIGDLGSHSTQERFEVILLQQIFLPKLRLEDLPQNDWNQWDMLVISILKPTDVRISKEMSRYLKINELATRAMISIAWLNLYDEEIILNVINYGKLFLNDINGLRNNATFSSLISYLNNAPKNNHIISFYEELMEKVKSSYLESIPGSLLEVLEYFSKNKITNKVALDLALSEWEKGYGGRNGWYSYKYLTSNPPCLQIERLKSAEEILYKNRAQWSAYSDESFDESMGATPKMTENFREVELFPRIQNACKSY